MAGESTPAIEVINLTKSFGQVRALDSVSLSISSGEMFFLLGPSGCGKTTLLRILAGLEKPDSGTIRFAGRDIADLPPHERGAPMVFQNYALWPHLTVKENIAFGLVERRIAGAEIEKRVRDVMEQVELGGMAARMPGQLSGGQQQRVVLARALVLNPGIILLDEPLSNLDAKLRLEMREAIEKLHKSSGITFIYVTHDQVEALSLADRMAVMSAGKINAMGTPADLYHRPPNTFCAEFLGEANRIPCNVLAAEGNLIRVSTPFGEWLVASSPGSRWLPGTQAVCIVRTECLKPGREELLPGFNSFKAVTSVLRMNGPTITVLLSSNGIQIKATILNERLPPVAPGATAGWFVAYDNAVLTAK